MHKLALALGGMTVDEMAERMTGDELMDWVAYDRIDPFGNDRADLRAGIVALSAANASSNKRRRPPKLTDFIPNFEQKKAKSGEELFRKLKLYADIHNARLDNG